VARITPKGTLVLEYSWEEPHAGTGIDEFSVDEQGYLCTAGSFDLSPETVEIWLLDSEVGACCQLVTCQLVTCQYGVVMAVSIRAVV